MPCRRRQPAVSQGTARPARRRPAPRAHSGPDGRPRAEGAHAAQTLGSRPCWVTWVPAPHASTEDALTPGCGEDRRGRRRQRGSHGNGIVPPHSDRVASRASCLRGGRWTSAAARACRRHRECSGCPQARAQDSAQALTLQQPDLWERGALECPVCTPCPPTYTNKGTGPWPCGARCSAGVAPSGRARPTFPACHPDRPVGRARAACGGPGQPRTPGRASSTAGPGRSAGWGRVSLPLAGGTGRRVPGRARGAATARVYCSTFKLNTGSE